MRYRVGKGRDAVVLQKHFRGMGGTVAVDRYVYHVDVDDVVAEIVGHSLTAAAIDSRKSS
ncbi:MAG: hypothetical protein NC111_05920 [Bacteroides sp.]|nr:hypothetical protein [Bacteroides sp.]MCM1413211.1 hypothetical protein [Bacteroides sp.]MCM1472045.1 hypothetical protein [Bacteroides sp.]